MAERNIRLERMLLALFVASGFAGLIYQSIWSHYLGLSLGHAAYAQTLVLTIFMGGMAIGAWLVSHYGIRWQRLIFAYAVVELIIGVAGIGFHAVFVQYTALSQGTIYPALDSIFAVRAWQWGSAAVLIAPQSILLGMTFPLMSGGYLRIAPRADGEILGGLYFSNSIGAALGALVATFLLLPWVGMPGTVAIAGVLNILIGVLAWTIARRADVLGSTPKLPTPDLTSRTQPASRSSLRITLLVAAGITGASSFVYEISWIRMLNQSLGTTIHSFELMLSAFILGLAFGGWWIRKRSQRISDVASYAGYAQIWMGLAALLSVPMFAQSFRWVGWFMDVLPKDDLGYALFSIGSAGIALLVMFPAAFFAGMTLPLFTMALLRHGEGEASIGRVYAANTLGAIIGVMLAVHLLIPQLGLRLAVTIAALADIALGVFLLRRWAQASQPRVLGGALLATIFVAITSLLFGNLDPLSLASGVYRHGRTHLDKSAKVEYLRDGKTATIAFFTFGSTGTIATNGKPDASIQLDPGNRSTADEITMSMAAALPLAIHKKPERVAIIGWGSGLSTHSILGSDTPKIVDTIEIEQAMVEGASLFGERVERAYRDPRSKLHIDDARTYFSTGQRRFDVIISEPSNPWVSGVASLFTQEFYRFLRSHLNDGGLVVQWMQSYELTDELMATMASALITEFPNVDVYVTNSSDLLLVASEAPIPPVDYARLKDSVLSAELKRVGLNGVGDFEVRKIATRQTLQTLVALYDATPHSDFYPVVSLNAPRARFEKSRVWMFSKLVDIGMPILNLTGVGEPPAIANEIAQSGINEPVINHWNALYVRATLLNNELQAPMNYEPKGGGAAVELLRDPAYATITDTNITAWLQAVAIAADLSIAYLPAEDHVGVWIDPVWIDLQATPPVIQAIMAAYSAAATRNGPQMQSAGLAALQQVPPAIGGYLREQMLVIAILGAIEQGNFTAAKAIELEQGAAVSASARYGFARSYLLAWLDVVHDVH
ncbi:MAG TPA: fused MFS/spermidine synthase [Dokdonella sp.]|uniref:fused MFS/spermidine synthase n=1 Tax=Dokdonella sp. TaxID=2291710 RepID=UPI002D80A09B|nr:fused MFS/spermidine synthase [Dokdonella sp.]HET9032600.1 fused MFS/spermidine synthase [Dokdonella sp.]